jgi:hypothetical protein
VNPYWSPLHSWLLVPFLLTGLEPLLEVTLLAAPVAGGVVVALGRPLRAVGVRPFATALTSLAVVPFRPRRDALRQAPVNR